MSAALNLTTTTPQQAETAARSFEAILRGTPAERWPMHWTSPQSLIGWGEVFAQVGKDLPGIIENILANKKEAAQSGQPHTNKEKPTDDKPSSRQKRSSSPSNSTGPQQQVELQRVDENYHQEDNRKNGSQEPVQDILPGGGSPAPLGKNKRAKRKVAATGFDYKHSPYRMVADRAVEEATSGRNDLPQVVKDDCAIGLGLLIAWCLSKLYQEVADGKWMTLGANRMREELKMRADRFRVNPKTEENRQKSIFYILQHLGLIQVVTVATDAEIKDGTAMPGAITSSEFDRLKSRAGYLLPNEGGDYLTAHTFEKNGPNKNHFYRLTGLTLTHVFESDLGQALPPFNPFESHLVNPPKKEELNRVIPMVRPRYDSNKPSHTSEGYESHQSHTSDAKTELGEEIQVRPRYDSRHRILKDLKKEKRKRACRPLSRTSVKRMGEEATQPARVTTTTNHPLTRSEKLELVKSDTGLNEIYGILANFHLYVPNTQPIEIDTALDLTLEGCTFDEVKIGVGEFIRRRSLPQWDKYDNLTGFFIKELREGKFKPENMRPAYDPKARLEAAKRQGQNRRKRYQEGQTRPAAPKFFPLAQAHTNQSDSHIPQADQGATDHVNDGVEEVASLVQADQSTDASNGMGVELPPVQLSTDEAGREWERVVEDLAGRYRLAPSALEHLGGSRLVVESGGLVRVVLADEVALRGLETSDKSTIKLAVRQRLGPGYSIEFGV